MMSHAIRMAELADAWDRLGTDPDRQAAQRCRQLAAALRKVAEQNERVTQAWFYCLARSDFYWRD
jgi:hypothetical protein